MVNQCFLEPIYEVNIWRNVETLINPEIRASLLNKFEYYLKTVDLLSAEQSSSLLIQASLLIPEEGNTYEKYNLEL